MLRLWGRTNSINVQKAIWALAETGAPHQRIDAGMAFGIVKTPEYLAMNPNALVPTLEDDGFCLWESNAIVRYLASKFPEKGLYPADLKQRADADRWMDWQQTTFNPALGPAFWGLIRTPAEKRDQTAITAAVAATGDLSERLEVCLATRPYVAGDTFTMGDIPIGCSVHRWLNLPCERPSRPHIEAWYKRLLARPASRTALTTPIT